MTDILKVRFLLFLTLVFWDDTQLLSQTEEYRPQFHYTPSSGWVGDPCGLMRYNNTYHFFGWNHATSLDLVYWQQLPYPMVDGDGSFSYFSGSCVVDLKNSSGFGIGIVPPMIAVYTMDINATGIQEQGLSYSNDYTYFHYYSGNPVLNLNSTNFRDPCVYWDSITNKWNMVVAYSANNQTLFYQSPDLKDWQFLGSFGPIGDIDQVWEDPDLFQLPVIDSVNYKKWVHSVCVGPNKVQYFIGNYNGYSFSIDTAEVSFFGKGIGLNGTVFDDFEQQNYGKWTTTGTAFGTGPVVGTLPGQNQVSGYIGNQEVNSYQGGDTSIGTLTSPVFTISQNCINFLIGGGYNPGMACINLIINDKIVESTTGDNSEALKWNGWNVTNWKGQQAIIQIIDSATESWGHILVDHIMFSNELLNFKRSNSHWADFGSDFYATRSFRNYDISPYQTTWMAWMDNWQYANATPTTYGQGNESLPRVLALKNFPEGLRLIQSPVPQLKELRTDSVVIDTTIVASTQTLTSFAPSTNSYELQVEFMVSTDTLNFGLNLCVGNGYKTTLGYDASISNVYLDRTLSGNVSFSPYFANLVSAPLLPIGGKIHFHIFVDQSTIEVFCNSGEVVLSSLIFPDPSNIGIQLFSNNGTVKLSQLKGWDLKSIWTSFPPTEINSVSEDVNVYPNPINSNQTIKLDFSNSSFASSDNCVQIYNSLGILVQKVFYPRNEGGFYEIKNNLQPGLYFVKLSNSLKSKTVKLIIL